MYNKTASSIVQSHSSIYSKAFLTGLIIAASLVVANNVYAEDQLKVPFAFGVNAANGAMYRINFNDTTPSIRKLITEEQEDMLVRVEGLAIAESLTGLTAYLADTNADRIWACPNLPVLVEQGPPINCDVVWDQSIAADGPTNPVSIEVLTNNDLIVATAGNSASAFSEIWLIPHCSPAGVGGCPVTGFRAPALVDGDVKVWFDADTSGASVRNLEQLHVDTQFGDVSVVGFNPAVWLKYSADFLADVSAAAISGSSPPPGFVPPETMAFPPGAVDDCSREFAVGEDPAGIAALPGFSEMLISVTNGVVQRWDLDGMRIGTAFDNCVGDDSPVNFLEDLGNTAFGLASTVDEGDDVGKVCLSNNNGGVYSLYKVEGGIGNPTPLAIVTDDVNAPRACEFSVLQLTFTGDPGTTDIVTEGLVSTTPIELLGTIAASGSVAVQDCIAEDPRYLGGGMYQDRAAMISEFVGADGCGVQDSSFLPPNLVCAPNAMGDALCVLVTVGFTGALNTLTMAAVLFDEAVNDCDGDGGAMGEERDINKRTRQGWTTLTGQGEAEKFANPGVIDDVTVTCNRVRSGTSKSSLHIGPLFNLALREDQLTDAIADLSTVIDGATSLKRKDLRNLQKSVKGVIRHSSRGRIDQALKTAEQLALNTKALTVDGQFASESGFIDRGLAIQARALRVAFILYDEFLNLQDYRFPIEKGFIIIPLPPP